MIEIIKKNIINFPGKKLNRKLLVFESDDWGTIRIPNKKTHDILLSDKLISSKDPFSRFDSLETNLDLSELFNTLLCYKDYKGNHPIITANTVVGNPDFDKIKNSDFNDYHFETFENTYNKQIGCDNSFESFKSGINEKLFFPQFHAREHLNLPIWMRLLQNNNSDFRKAFELSCFSIDFKHNSNRRNNLMAAYDYENYEDFQIIDQSINQGLDLFEMLFGFKSESSIAPCYVWDKKVESILLNKGVKYIQGSRFQNIPQKESLRFKKKFHYNGQFNNFGQIYLQRNGLFEPSLNENIDWVDKCLESIEIAFKWNKPAVIGTHRLNYIGSIFPKNRDNGLIKLDILIKKILQKWPEVEFVSTVDLGNIYAEL